MRIGETTVHFLPPEEIGTVLTAREKTGTDPD